MKSGLLAVIAITAAFSNHPAEASLSLPDICIIPPLCHPCGSPQGPKCPPKPSVVLPDVGRLVGLY